MASSTPHNIDTSEQASARSDAANPRKDPRSRPSMDSWRPHYASSRPFRIPSGSNTPNTSEHRGFPAAESRSSSRDHGRDGGTPNSANRTTEGHSPALLQQIVDFKVSLVPYIAARIKVQSHASEYDAARRSWEETKQQKDFFPALREEAEHRYLKAVKTDRELQLELQIAKDAQYTADDAFAEAITMTVAKQMARADIQAIVKNCVEEQLSKQQQDLQQGAVERYASKDDIAPLSTSIAKIEDTGKTFEAGLISQQDAVLALREQVSGIAEKGSKLEKDISDYQNSVAENIAKEKQEYSEAVERRISIAMSQVNEQINEVEQKLSKKAEQLAAAQPAATPLIANGPRRDSSASQMSANPADAYLAKVEHLTGRMNALEHYMSTRRLEQPDPALLRPLYENMDKLWANMQTAFNDLRSLKSTCHSLSDQYNSQATNLQSSIRQNALAHSSSRTGLDNLTRDSMGHLQRIQTAEDALRNVFTRIDAEAQRRSSVNVSEQEVIAQKQTQLEASTRKEKMLVDNRITSFTSEMTALKRDMASLKTELALLKNPPPQGPTSVTSNGVGVEQRLPEPEEDSDGDSEGPIMNQIRVKGVSRKRRQLSDVDSLGRRTDSPPNKRNKDKPLQRLNIGGSRSFDADL